MSESKSTKIEVFYYRRPGVVSHSYIKTWEKTDFFCPECGKNTVWQEKDGGDYYVGEDFMCASCGSDWNMPGGVSSGKDDEQCSQVFNVISKL